MCGADIDSFLTLLMHSSRDVHFFNTSWFKNGLVAIDTPGQPQQHQSVENFFDRKAIAAPCGVKCSHGTHWFICVAYIKPKIIVVYDSHAPSATYKDTRCKAGNLMLQWVQHEYETKCALLTSSDSAWKVVTSPKPPPTPQQSADASGIFVCNYALAVARGNALSLTSAGISTESDMRLFIIQCLLQGKIIGLGNDGDSAH